MSSSYSHLIALEGHYCHLFRPPIVFFWIDNSAFSRVDSAIQKGTSSLLAGYVWEDSLVGFYACILGIPHPFVESVYSQYRTQSP